jgi:hypothetical protein
MSTSEITGESSHVEEDTELDPHEDEEGEAPAAAAAASPFVDLNEDETPPATDVAGLMDDDDVFEELGGGEGSKKE